MEIGAELPEFEPEKALANVKRYIIAAGWNGPRFTDHEAARKEGLPVALVRGILSQVYLSARIHRWAPEALIHNLFTVFRAPLIVDEPCCISVVVTDIDEEAGRVEIDLTITNAKGETRVFGTAEVQLPA